MHCTMNSKPCMLTKDDFYWGVFHEGYFRGKNYVTLLPDHDGQKGNDLTLQNTTICNDKNRFAYAKIPQTSDPLGLYNILHKHIFEYFPPHANNNRILRRIADDKELAVSNSNLTEAFAILKHCYLPFACG